MSDPILNFAFSADQVCEITGLSKRQLRYWDQTEFFSPAMSDGRGRVYSFRDLVGLRTIARLRETVTLQELRKVGEWLHQHHETPWASLRFFRSGGTVHFRDPGSAKIVSTRPAGQTICVEMEEIVNETKQLVEKRRKRRQDQVGRVERRRSVVQNSPVLAGTRIPVDAIWNFHEAGYSIRRIRDEYPTLTTKDVKAAIEFARKRKRATA